MRGEQRRASYAGTVAVAFGWYATLLAAVLTGQAAVPSTPDDCGGTFGCGMGSVLLRAAGVLAALVAVPPTLVFAVPLSRRLGAAPIAGSLTALLTLGLLALLGYAWALSR